MKVIYQPETETLRTVPENYCVASYNESSGRWVPFEFEGALHNSPLISLVRAHGGVPTDALVALLNFSLRINDV